MEKRVDLLRPYLITILLLLGAGIIWTIANYQLNSMRFAGIVIAVGSCSVINLIYFIPVQKLPLRLLPPGIISILFFILINQGSSVERTFFTTFGVINLLIGIMWFIIKTNKRVK